MAMLVQLSAYLELVRLFDLLVRRAPVDAQNVIRVEGRDDTVTHHL